MGSIDNTTWQALGLTLTVLGLVGSFLLWRRRGPATGIRAAAWALLPLAAGLTGTLRLLWEIAESVGRWATRIVFSPVVWLGIVLVGISVVLFAVSAAMRNRGVGAGSRATKPRKAVTGEPSRPVAKAPKKGSPAMGGEDMEDIEAILKKHGIS